MINDIVVNWTFFHLKLDYSNFFRLFRTFKVYIKEISPRVSYKIHENYEYMNEQLMHM